MDRHKVLEITPEVKWIGILDPDLVTFDVVMETHFGTTYNSYFIDADKKAIVETAKEKYTEDYLNKVRKVVNPEKIEYIILDHTEPDHSGSLKHLLKIAPNAKVVGSGNALRYLQDIVDEPFESIKVKDGDELDLGNKTIRFIGAPNLHWPDSMFSYLVEDKILFSCDGFGAHFCHEAMFDDEVGNWDEAFRYYFDVIIKPFSKFMLKAIEKIRPLDISMICPGHGPIMRSNWKTYVDRTEEMSKNFLNESQPKYLKVFLPYVSAYGYTRNMASAIEEGLKEAGDIEVEILDIEHTPLGEVDAKLTHSQGIIVGSPTINQNILMPIYKLFATINPLRDKQKLAGAFGSYGWSGEGVKIIEENLRNLKFKIFQTGIAAKFNPDEELRERLRIYGLSFGRELIKLNEK